MKIEETRKLISGTVYDIEGAEMIGWGSNMSYEYEPSLDETIYHVQSIGNLVVERLYQAKDGKYFVYGMGGNRSEYAEQYVTGMGAGSDICLIDEEDIASWAERYNLVDVYLKLKQSCE